MIERTRYSDKIRVRVLTKTNESDELTTQAETTPVK
jgi:hypothetical protein